MSRIVIIGAGAMGSAFALPCLDNNHDINIVGTHLENDFIDQIKSNENLHPGLKTKIPNEIKIFKFDKFDELLKSCIFSINLTLELSPIKILFLYWQNPFLVLLKNKISIGSETTVFFSTEILNPEFERAELSKVNASSEWQSYEEKPLIFKPVTFGKEMSFSSEKMILFLNPKL